jgi:hypothetical protein
MTRERRPKPWLQLVVMALVTARGNASAKELSDFYDMGSQPPAGRTIS